jgi:hypothetical protein
MDYRILKKIDTDTAIGKRIISFLITEENRKKLSAYLKARKRARMLRHEFEDRASNLKDLINSSVQHITPVTQPLVLISQLPRCGGILLGRLFDGHPELHVHPGELSIGFGKREKLPPTKMDLGDHPKRWLAFWAENTIAKHLKEVQLNLEKLDSTQQLVLIPYLQKKIFLQYLKSINQFDLRQMYNAYMTSYFGAWLNNVNFCGNDKKYIVGYSPGLALNDEGLKQYFEIYPQGRLISILRNPQKWIDSNLLHKKDYPDAATAINHWRKYAQSMLRNKKTFGDRVCIIRFEELTAKTEAVMRYLSKILNIEYDGILRTPTFNQTRLIRKDYVESTKTLGKNRIKQSQGFRLEEHDSNYRRTMDDYKSLLGKTVPILDS